MGFWAVDSLLTAVIAAGVVVLVLVGNEFYFRTLHRRESHTGQVRTPLK